MIEFFRCWCPLHIRYCDLDTLAHVNNSVYFVYFEEARSYYFNQLPRPEEKWSAEEEREHPEPESRFEKLKQESTRSHRKILRNNLRTETLLNISSVLQTSVDF